MRTRRSPSSRWGSDGDDGRGAMIRTQPSLSVHSRAALLCALLLGGATSGCATFRSGAASRDLLATSSPTAADTAQPSAMTGASPASPADIRRPSLWSHLGRSATRALRSPALWVPSTVALLLQIDDLDGRLSDWARRETPVFGSQARAEHGSDALLGASVITYAALVAITPGPHGPGPWLREKSLRGAAGLGIIHQTCSWAGKWARHLACSRTRRLGPAPARSRRCRCA